MDSSSKSFAGIGARKTPAGADTPYDELMRRISYKLCYQERWVMTSGGAEGADTFFQEGLAIPGFDPIEQGLFELYLPWKGFNKNHKGIIVPHDTSDVMHNARKILMDHKVYENEVYKKTPRFIYLEGEDRKQLTRREIAIATLHTRNVFQILRLKLNNPVKMVICYTPDKATTQAEYSSETGGTGIAINLADSLEIPVFNLAREDHLKRLCDFVEMEWPEQVSKTKEDTSQPSLF